MNEITIHGNTSRSNSIKLNHSAGGTAVVTFSVAIPDRYFDRQAGQWRDRPPVWQRVVCFGRLPTVSSSPGAGTGSPSTSRRWPPTCSGARPISE